MSIIEKTTSLGALYISNKNSNMAIKIKDDLISDQEEVDKIICDNRIPIKVQFEITERCNFNCYYCYAKSLRNKKDLSTEQVKDIIDKLDEMGIVFLEITGGEPLARKDFLEILKYINSKNFIVSMITNGSLLTEEIVKELKNASVELIRLSLLAPTDEICDKLTGVEGSFKKTIKAAKLLKENKINFNLTSVLTKENIDLSEEYKELEKEIGIKILYGIDVGASITGYKDVEQYALDESDANKIKLFVDPVDLQNSSELICSAGRSKFAIDNEGNVMPCLRARDILGNILEDSFEEIWNSAQLKSIVDQKLQPAPECIECENKSYCGAYCPGEYVLYENDKVRCRSANMINKLIKCN